MIKVGMDCTGCSACAQVCPVQSIHMVQSADGFIRPEVHEQGCIHCGKCETVCPVQHKLLEKQMIKAYYLSHRDQAVLLGSSSGGAFYAIAQWILTRKGVVFGAAFDIETKMLVYKSTDDVALDELMRSKYVESYVGNAFKEVREHLNRGRWVAFCGTPCHVAGLKNYLGKAYDKLILIDFTCGGVPSQSLLADHLNGLEKKYRSRVKSMNFRDKRYCWKRYCLTVTFENGKEYSRIAEFDPYLWTFLHTKATKRAGCAACKFQAKHCADFVIADFWKVNSFPDVPTNGNRGLSLVLCQTQKAQSMMQELDEVDYGEIRDSEAAQYNLRDCQLTDEQQIQLESDRLYLRKYGLRRYYYKQVGLYRILKYAVKSLMLEVQRRGKI